MNLLDKLFTLTIILGIVRIQCLKINNHAQSTVTYDSLKAGFGSSIDYKYYDNLNSANVNYYYGSITKQAYEMSVKLYKMDDYEQCSSLTPYATKDMQSCTTCPTDRPLFNLGTRQCQPCKPYITKKCDQIFNINTPSQPTNNQTNATLIQNNTSNTSVSSNTSTTKPSSGIPAPTNTASATNTTKTTTNITNNTTALDQNIDSPYVVEWVPNRVADNTTKNASTQTNQTSQTNSAFQPVPDNPSDTLHENYTIDYRVVDNNGKIIPGNQTDSNLIAQSQGQNATFYNQQCPPDTPFFNSNTKLCESCKPSEQYVFAQKKCLPVIYVSNPNNNYVILQQPDQLLKANLAISTAYPERTVRICPLTAPIAVNNTCIACSQALIFNFTKQACQEGCPQGLIFSSANSKCIPATYLTNLQASNLLSPLKDFQTYRNAQKIRLNSSSAIVQCPIVNPILINNKCSNCSAQKPLFNIQSQECEQCSRNRFYDSLTKKCSSVYNSGLQVKKMIPNIF